ncbi:hypothetical protein [Porphyromonas endodontalis]
MKTTELTTQKLNNIMRTTRHGEKTIKALVNVLSQYTDLSKLTGAQIGELINAMYASKENGYNECGKEFGNW